MVTGDTVLVRDLCIGQVFGDRYIDPLSPICRYNGRETDPPSKFPSAMEEACSIIEHVVNEEMRNRKRLPLEWGGVPSSNSDEPIWRANFAASNLYEGAKEGVGFHSDRLTTLGPYPTIASLSLGKPLILNVFVHIHQLI